MTRRVRVFCPATLSNLGPGFDVLGLALREPGDIVEGELRDQPGVEIVAVEGDGGLLSCDPAVNVVGVAAAHVLERVAAIPRSPTERHPAERNPAEAGSHRNHRNESGIRLQADFTGRPLPGVRLWLRKGLPIASGLGGSAASSVGGAFVVNELLGRPFSRLELVESALAGEKLAAVTAHGDNIVPCLLGGIVLIRTLAPLDVIPLPVPPGLHIAAVHPHCQVSTAAARALVGGRQYPLGAATLNAANLGAFVSALYRNDLALLGRSIEDRLVEPLRAPLVPGFARVKAAALAGGALACSISGSGPTMFAIADSESAARGAGDAMCRAFREAAGLESDVFVGQVNADGVQVTTP